MKNERFNLYRWNERVGGGAPTTTRGYDYEICYSSVWLKIEERKVKKKFWLKSLFFFIDLSLSFVVVYIMVIESLYSY
jgi:hypothetical protein